MARLVLVWSKRCSEEKRTLSLYISPACPGKSCLHGSSIKGLEDFTGLSIVLTNYVRNGWTFADDEGVIKDPVMDADYLHQNLYRSKIQIILAVTVPVLYDLKEDRIINNESSDIIRMLNTAFDDFRMKED